MVRARAQNVAANMAIGLVLLLGACSSGGRAGDTDATGSSRDTAAPMSDGELRELYQAEAASTRWLQPGHAACPGLPQVDMVTQVNSALALRAVTHGPVDHDFVRRARLAAETGALDLYGIHVPPAPLSIISTAPEDGQPCIEQVRVERAESEWVLVAVLNRGTYPFDVVWMSRCLFRDINLGFEYRIERAAGDDPATRECLLSGSSKGLCRPSCADLA